MSSYRRTIIPHITRYLGDSRIPGTAFLLGGGEIRSAFEEKIIIMRSLISRRGKERESSPRGSLDLLYLSLSSGPPNSRLSGVISALGNSGLVRVERSATRWRSTDATRVDRRSHVARNHYRSEPFTWSQRLITVNVTRTTWTAPHRPTFLRLLSSARAVFAD